jgi:hypothetical protein
VRKLKPETETETLDERIEKLLTLGTFPRTDWETKALSIIKEIRETASREKRLRLQLEVRATTAEQLAQDWQRRFDDLLSRVPKTKGLA